MMCTPLQSQIKDKHLIISVVAGTPIKAIEENLPDGSHLIRVMPNIACTVRQAISAICASTHATESDLETARTIFGSVGRTVVVPEQMMDAVTGLSGSGPAFVFPAL